MFIDMHCHILPEIDDGAASVVQSCELIKLASATGTTIMTATPHFNNLSRCKSVLSKEKIIYSYRNLKSVLQSKNIPVAVYLGSELLADSNIEQLCRSGEIITLNATRYLLTEFYFDERINNVYKYIDILISYGYIPVIAHPERYSFFSNEKEMIYRLLDIGCKIQINKGSPLGRYGVQAQKISEWLLDNDMVHLISSDCHNVSLRNSDMGEIYSLMLDKYSISKINRLMHDNPKRILLDADI